MFFALVISIIYLLDQNNVSSSKSNKERMAGVKRAHEIRPKQGMGGSIH